MRTEEMQSFGAVLKRYRMARGLTHEQLAERAGLSVRGISDLERGVRVQPRAHTVHQLAVALRLSSSERAILEEAATRPMSTLPGTAPGRGPTPLDALPARRPGTGGMRRVIHRHRISVIATGALLLLAVVALAFAFSPRPSHRAAPLQTAPNVHSVAFSFPPNGLTVGQDGSLYVSEFGCVVSTPCPGTLDQIWKLGPSGVMLAGWGSHHNGNMQTINNPEGLAQDSAGNIYVADAAPSGSDVQVFSPAGRLLHVFPRRGAEQARLAVDHSGNVYVTDIDDDHIVKYSTTGKVLAVWGGTGTRPGKFESLGGLAVRGNTVYVADSGNDRIRAFTISGRFIREWGRPGSRPGQLNDPVDVAVGPDGVVYVADQGNDRIDRFSTRGKPLGALGRRGIAPGQMRGPFALAFGPQGTLFVDDRGNDRIEEISPRGAFIASWGRTWIPVGDTAVRLCVSGPLSVPPVKRLSVGIFDGVRLASAQWKRRLRDVHLRLLPPIVMADSTNVALSMDRERENAERCLRRSDTLGYIAPLNSASSLASESILNRGRMAMVSPSNTDPTLTAPSQRATQEPLTAAHRLQHVTYFRLEGTDFSDGAGAAAFMRTDLHLGAYFLVKDTGEGFPVPQYEAMGMDSYARGHLGMKRTGEGQLDWSDPDALVRSEKTVATRIARRRPPGVFCACSSDSSAGLVEQLRAHGYRKPVVIGEIGYDPHTVIQVGAAYHNLYTAGIETVDPSQASPAFQRAFRRTFHTSLLSFDASAYDAASLVLNAVYRAARDGSYHGTIESKRLTVLNRVATSRYRGVSGPISFDRNGDNVLGRVSIYVARYKRWTFLTVAPPTPGALRTG